MDTPQKTPNKEYDFTGMDTPMFRYKVLSADGKEILSKELDMDGIALELNMAIPTALSPTEEIDPNTKELKSGLQVVFEAFQNGTMDKLPSHLPPFKSVLYAFRKALDVPPHCGHAVLMAVISAWGEETKRRMELKKDTPVLPDSPAVSA